MSPACEVSGAALRRLGQQAGFDSIGATTAAPFPELIPQLEAYAERGLTGFEHSDIAQRVNPKAWFPEAEALIAVAMAYLTEDGRQTARRHPSSGQHGAVTVYAYGEDYHTVMTSRCHQLMKALEAEVGHPISYRVAVDTAPLVDRRVAERSGIGWVGKNCMFFTPTHGSFVFLGTIAIDTSVECTGPIQESHCGSCSQCLQACPTGALLAPGVIDATRCLSYITQMKGTIPLEYRAAMGRRVWGCDTCQWACPENEGKASAGHEEFLPTGELEYPDLVEILGWTNRQFLQRYGKTAAAWRGLRTWKRNALIALGNTRREHAVAHISPFLVHQRKELRVSAAWALGRIGGGSARRELERVRIAEPDAEVSAEITRSLEMRVRPGDK